jgi:hypothetical protein
MTATCLPLPWASSSPMPSGCTTCMEMPGSIAPTGTARNTTPRPPYTTRQVQIPVPAIPVSLVAVAGAMGRASPVPPLGSGPCSAPTPGAPPWAFVLPGLSNAMAFGCVTVSALTLFPFYVSAQRRAIRETRYHMFVTSSTPVGPTIWSITRAKSALWRLSSA